MTSSHEGFVCWEGERIWLADGRRRFLSECSLSYPNNPSFPFRLGVVKKTKKEIPRGEGGGVGGHTVKNKGEKDDVQIRKCLLSSCGAIPDSVFVERMQSSAAE